MRILVTAASRHGATAEIAAELAKALRAALPDGHVDVAHISRISGIDGYVEEDPMAGQRPDVMTGTAVDRSVARTAGDPWPV